MEPDADGGLELSSGVLGPLTCALPIRASTSVPVSGSKWIGITSSTFA